MEIENESPLLMYASLLWIFRVWQEEEKVLLYELYAIVYYVIAPFEWRLPFVFCASTAPKKASALPTKPPANSALLPKASWHGSSCSTQWGAIRAHSDACDGGEDRAYLHEECVGAAEWIFSLNTAS